MDLFSEIEDLNSLFCGEKNHELNCGNGFEDFENKYTSLHENYSKEVDNSKKVGKSLAKCLKFYAKLCKKYEVQQKLISNLELTIQEKNSAIEECQKNIEKMTGLIRIYETERISFKGPAYDDIKKDKEMLLDICCGLIGEVDRNSCNTRNLGKQLLRKFRKDLSDERINVIKERTKKIDEKCFDVKPPDLLNFNQNKTQVKFEEKYSKELKKDVEDEQDKESKNTSLEFGLIEGKEERAKESEKASIDLNVTKGEDELSEKSINASVELNVTEREKDLIKVPEKVSPGSKVVEGDKRLEGGCKLCASELPSLPVLEDSVDALKRAHGVTKSNSAAIPVVTLNLESIEKQPPSCNLNNKKNIFEVNVSNNCFSSEIVSVDSELSFTAIVEEDSIFSDEDLEKEVNRISAELILPRLLSPIPLLIDEQNVPVVPEISKDCESTVKKRKPSEAEGDISVKKLKPCGPLDSIMSAMSLQNEVFKSSGNPAKENSFRFTRSFTRANGMRKSDENKGNLKENSFFQKNRQQAEETMVRKGLDDFVKAPITCKEEADKNVRQCIGILSNKSEELIARLIVAIVLENVDEPIEVFERPAPPLTKTQHRLVVLLSVFQKLDTNSEKVPLLILSMISKKLFPDNFFWPDDSIEAATRFYTALCRSKNDTKSVWKFCIHAMTSMRQRCPVAVFALLQTWPDVLHDSSVLKDNILALTVVNLFLHMPKSEGLRNLNQKRKLIALKHLLMNFYQFRVEDTIENYAKNVAESVLSDEVGAKKSLVMLAKCRDADWAVKNLVPTLKNAVVRWGKGIVDDEAALRILSVIKQMSPVLSEAKDSNGSKVREMIASLCEILNLGSKSHESEVEVVEVLLKLKQHEEARKAVSEWIPKKPIEKSLQHEIINMSAENVLKELKRNREREEKKSLEIKKPKKKAGKKKRKKKRKNTGLNGSGVSS